MTETNKQRKFNVAFEAPVLNRSGYGLVSDMIFHAIKTYPMFNLLVLPTSWGGCAPRLTRNEGDADIVRCIPKTNQVPQPHILISNTIPYMSKPQGTMFNINFCAGVETTELPDMFMNAVNKWNLNIVCSNFSKQGYLNSKIKPTQPVEVIGHGVNTNVYKMTDEKNEKIEAIMSKVTENEAFLFVGQVTSPHLFGDRKDMSSLIKVFCETFKNKTNKPALILKTGGTSCSTQDRNITLERIKLVKEMVENNDVNVYLIHGELNDEEMNALYNHKKVIAGISFTHGEGFGLPLLQQTLAGKPVIVSNYSGHLDFLPEGKFVPIAGSLQTIPHHLVSEFFLPTAQWFQVDYEAAKQTLNDFYYGDRTEINKQAVILANQNSKEFSLAAFERKIHKTLDKYLLGK